MLSKAIETKPMATPMNMQVANLTSTTVIPVAALAIGAAEPIISLIEAYEAGAKAYREADDDSDDFAQATYGEPFDQIVGGAWEIQTVAGAIAALRFAKKEEGYHLDSLATGPLIDAALRFLESASGSTLVHPDAELLALDAQLEPLEREDETIHDKLNETQAEWQRVHDDRTGLEFTRVDQMYFGSGIKDDGRNTICPWSICYIEPLDLAVAYPTARQRVIGHNERLEELRGAYRRWHKAIDDFNKSSGREALAERSEALYELRAPLMDEILATPARTLAGLAVKAKMVKRQNPKWWKIEPKYLGFEDECCLSLIEDTLAAGWAAA